LEPIQTGLFILFFAYQYLLYHAIYWMVLEISIELVTYIPEFGKKRCLGVLM